MVWDANHDVKSVSDLVELKASMTTAVKRKAVPQWTVPLEIWTMMLNPRWRCNPAREE